MVPVAPGDVIPVLDTHDPGVVTIDKLADLGVVGDELERLRVDLPVEAVVGKASVQLHPPSPIVAAEHAGKAAFERHHGAVEDAVGGRYQVPWDDRVARIAPQRPRHRCRAVLPWEVGQRWVTNDFEGGQLVPTFLLVSDSKLVFDRHEVARFAFHQAARCRPRQGPRRASVPRPRSAVARAGRGCPSGSAEARLAACALSPERARLLGPLTRAGLSELLE